MQICLSLHHTYLRMLDRITDIDLEQLPADPSGVKMNLFLVGLIHIVHSTRIEWQSSAGGTGLPTFFLLSPDTSVYPHSSVRQLSTPHLPFLPAGVSA